jgi:Wiskott-Aldrich syndrome protein
MTIIKTLTINKRKKDKKEKLTKADIGKPADFKHISHVGWDPTQGFTLQNVEPKWLKFLPKVRQLFD